MSETFSDWREGVNQLFVPYAKTVYILEHRQPSLKCTCTDRQRGWFDTYFWLQTPKMLVGFSPFLRPCCFLSVQNRPPLTLPCLCFVLCAMLGGEKKRVGLFFFYFFHFQVCLILHMCYFWRVFLFCVHITRLHCFSRVVITKNTVWRAILHISPDFTDPSSSWSVSSKAIKLISNCTCRRWALPVGLYCIFMFMRQ